MSCRRAYISKLEATGPHFAAALGLIARIRQHVSGHLPTRKDWIDDLDGFAESEGLSALDAEKLLSKYFPLTPGPRPTALKLGHDLAAGNLLLRFMEHWFDRKQALFQSPRAVAILDRLTFDGENIRARMWEAQEKDISADSMIQRIVGRLADTSASWAPGLRLFDWHSVRTGFVGYEPIDRSDVRGLYLVVREARDWTTSGPQTPATLVRDLLWVRASPGAPRARHRPDFEGVGRFFSTFNKTAYALARGVQAGDWCRYQGAPLRTEPNESLDIEIACPSLNRLDGGSPHFAMMTAHTKQVQSPGAWKTIIWRIDGDEWADIYEIEPELEMFCHHGGNLSDTKMRDLVTHLQNRGVIGEYQSPKGEAKAPALVFHEALIDYEHAPNTRAKLEKILRGAVEAGQAPVDALLSAWPSIAPNQIILPPIENARVTHADAQEALFSRGATGGDKIARALKSEVARGLVTMGARTTASGA